MVRGSQQVARQCLVAAVNRKNEQVRQKESTVETVHSKYRIPRREWGLFVPNS